MALRGVLAGAVLAIIAAPLIGCDDFKGHPPPAPTANRAPTAPATPIQTPSGAPLTAAPAPTADLQAPPGDEALTQPPQPDFTARGAAPAQGSDAAAGKAIDDAVFTSRATAAQRRRLLIKAQVILDRAHFSPGVVDGRDGTNFHRALAAFEAARGVGGAAPGGTAPLDAAAWKALIAEDGAPVTQDHPISAEEVKGPFLGTLPRAMADQAKLPHLGYTAPIQALAAKFHMDQALLRSLNPGVDFTVAGTRIVAVRPGEAALPAVARVEVDKSADEVRAYDGGGKLVAAFPATVGSTERPAPSGELAVRFVVANPTYTYDPSRLTFGKAAGGKLTLQAGPNNPVGSTWIELSVETYGIHGAPDPTEIGKTASHGCVRLTNWDAAALGRAVKKGTPVVFVGAARRA